METTKNKKYNLEERLITFSLSILEIVERLPENRIGSHIGGQLMRSGTSPAFNYGEAQGAESRNDFIHKMKLCLKELRETQIAMKIIQRKPLLHESRLLETSIGECNELISIFVKSISTAQTNKPAKT
ncbi:MAG TPA: four helix bundle protein [Bacteroidia bacterium]|nr:four helix bundle protein [Bacteroidia bacterium]